MIELREITRENLERVLKLSVSDAQKGFVSSVAFSLSQAYVYRETAFPLAVYAGEKAVGFMMFGYYEEKKQYTLWKFLIDKEHQSRGYGKAALLKGIMYMKNRFAVRELYLGVSVGNERAKGLYRSVGFKETGVIEENMEEMRLIC